MFHKCLLSSCRVRGSLCARKLQSVSHALYGPGARPPSLSLSPFTPRLSHCLLHSSSWEVQHSSQEPELSPREAGEKSSRWVFPSCLGLDYAGN